MNEYIKKDRYSLFKFWCYGLLSLVYALLLSSMSNDLFRDRSSYIFYAANYESVAEKYTFFSFLFNEPIFLLYNSVLSFFLVPEDIPKVGVFFISATFSYFIFKYSRNLLAALLGLTLLFFVSYTFNLQLVVLRQGIAAALLMWGVHFFWKKNIFIPFCFLLSFFHVSFFVVFFVLVCENLLRLFVNNLKLRLVILFLVLFFTSLLMLDVANYLGVRQAQGEHLKNNVSGGGGFVLFLFVLFFLYLRGLGNVCRNRFGYIATLGILSYLAFYFTIPISGRLIGTFLPFYYVYLVSDNNLKVIMSAIVFLIVNFFLFHGSISGGSLTHDGVIYLNNFLSFYPN